MANKVARSFPETTEQRNGEVLRGAHLTRAMTALGERLMKLKYPESITHIYNPLAYAQKPFAAYLARYGKPGKTTLLLGMNPGPFGMAQTGVPFGEVSRVRDWLEINEPVEVPEVQHPKRPITGFACRRSEVSGARLWDWAKQNFKTPDAFARHFFVYNYCPLAFMEASGKNVTPDKLPQALRAEIYRQCDAVLVQIAASLGVQAVVGIGAFARVRAEKALPQNLYRIAQILHPSPASPLANRGWAAQASRQMREAGIAFGIKEAELLL